MESVQNQLVYTTVKIIAGDGLISSIGTGFFIQRDSETGPINFLVTNKHVVANYEKAEIVFLCQKD
jgi:S1-C subfamily serine protease